MACHALKMDIRDTNYKSPSGDFFDFKQFITYARNSSTVCIVYPNLLNPIYPKWTWLLFKFFLVSYQPPSSLRFPGQPSTPTRPTGKPLTALSLCFFLWVRFSDIPVSKKEGLRMAHQILNTLWPKGQQINNFALMLPEKCLQFAAALLSLLVTNTIELLMVKWSDSCLRKC